MADRQRSFADMFGGDDLTRGRQWIEAGRSSKPSIYKLLQEQDPRWVKRTFPEELFETTLDALNYIPQMQGRKRAQDFFLTKAGELTKKARKLFQGQVSRERRKRTKDFKGNIEKDLEGGQKAGLLKMSLPEGSPERHRAALDEESFIIEAGKNFARAKEFAQPLPKIWSHTRPQGNDIERLRLALEARRAVKPRREGELNPYKSGQTAAKVAESRLNTLIKSIETRKNRKRNEFLPSEKMRQGDKFDPIFYANTSIPHPDSPTTDPYAFPQRRERINYGKSPSDTQSTLDFLKRAFFTE